MSLLVVVLPMLHRAPVLPLAEVVVQMLPVVAQTSVVQAVEVAVLVPRLETGLTDEPGPIRFSGPPS
jgi:hypothetical protein